MESLVGLLGKKKETFNPDTFFTKEQQDIVQEAFSVFDQVKLSSYFSLSQTNPNLVKSHSSPWSVGIILDSASSRY